MLAFDRVANVIVMEDKWIFTIPNPEVIPADLVAGETITIDFKHEGDYGVVKIQSITRGWPASPPSARRAALPRNC